MGSKPAVYDDFSRPPSGGLDCSDSPSKTKQEFAAEADLNVIMARYTQTGELPESIVGTYGDFSDAPDFMAAQLIIARADAQFSSLPADVRLRFNNEPAQFLEFVHDPANYEEALELGLLSKEAEVREAAAKAAVAPVAAVSVNPAPSLPKSS